MEDWYYHQINWPSLLLWPLVVIMKFCVTYLGTIIYYLGTNCRASSLVTTNPVEFRGMLSNRRLYSLWAWIWYPSLQASATSRDSSWWVLSYLRIRICCFHLAMWLECTFSTLISLLNTWANCWLWTFIVRCHTASDLHTACQTY
jgi:hypothetical protein